MLLSALIYIPFIGLIFIFSYNSYDLDENSKILKTFALAVTIINLAISLIIWLLFNNSSKHFQFIQEHFKIGHYDFYLGIDGLSMYFILLTTLIMPIAILSN
jgi:NADH-ubiquinone oxidoreductase chain 4